MLDVLFDDGFVS